jgi:hypothetical protein
MRLSGPSPESRNGTTLGGSFLNASGMWHATKTEPVHLKGGELSILVPAASAAILTLEQ